MKLYTPEHGIVLETNVDILNRVTITKPISVVQYDSLPILKVNLYYGKDPYAIPADIDLVRVRMGRLPKQYYYKDILGWATDKQSVYIQVEEDMTKDVGEFGLVVEMIKFNNSKSQIIQSARIDITIEQNTIQEKL